MRIVLISPRGPLYRHKTGIWEKSLRYQPLTLTTLASKARTRDLRRDRPRVAGL